MAILALALAITMHASSQAKTSPAKPASAGQVAPATPAPAQKPPTPAPAAPSPAALPSPAKPATASPAAPAAAPAPPAPAAPAPQPPVESYTYRADGRRDPFQSLVGLNTANVPGSRRGEGPAGMTFNEISVRGVMQSRGSLVAMITGPDNKTYIVHPGDKLLDGTIKTIMPQGIVVVQEVNDPLSLVKQREVRKLLRSLEDAKE